MDDRGQCRWEGCIFFFFSDITDRDVTPCILSVMILQQVQHTKEKHTINCELAWKLKYSTMQIEQIENQTLTCMFSPEKKKKKSVLRCGQPSPQLLFDPLNPFCPAPLPWNGISINLQPIEVMMAWNYGCLSRAYSPLCSPSLWVQGPSLRLGPSPMPSFSPSSPSLFSFAS